MNTTRSGFAPARSPILRGGTIEYEVEMYDAGDAAVVLGYDNLWIVQRRTEGGWRGVLSTSPGVYQMCATRLDSGVTTNQRVTTSNSEFESESRDVYGDLTPGRHRYVPLGITPLPAVDFLLYPPGRRPRVLNGERRRAVRTCSGGRATHLYSIVGSSLGIAGTRSLDT